MTQKKFKFRIRVLRVFFTVNAVFIFFWWPLSHWLYPDLYHELLGFESGSYSVEMVRVIGTCGIFPVLMMGFSAADPLKNSGMIFILTVFSFFISLTFLLNVIQGLFPVKEMVNVLFSAFSGFFILFVYPWLSTTLDA